MRLYIEISAHFGIESVENLVDNRRNRFSEQLYSSQSDKEKTDVAKQTIIYVECCADCFVCLQGVFLFIAFV